MSYSYKVEPSDAFPYKVYDDQDWDKTIVSKFVYEKDAAVYCRWRNSNAGHEAHVDGPDRNQGWSTVR